MRVVVLGAGGRHKTEASIVRGLRVLGHQARLVNAVTLVRYAGPVAGRVAQYLCDGFHPDFLILTRHAIDLGETTLRAILRDRPAAFWYFDLLAKESAIALGRLVGTMYVTYLGQLDRYRRAGIEVVRFLPQGVDPEWDAPASSAPAAYSCDVSFVGSGKSSYRYPVLRAVAGMSRLQIRGPGWSGAPADLPVTGGPVYGRDLARVIRGASISLGVSSHPQQDIDRASASNRMWKILGCGGFYLGPHVRGIESFAADGKHCAWYRGTQQVIELVRHYLARGDERERIAQAGRAHALRHHTYARRLTLLLEGKEYAIPAGDAQTIR
jgi:spore maturation protein CgeB